MSYGARVALLKNDHHGALYRFGKTKTRNTIKDMISEGLLRQAKSAAFGCGFGDLLRTAQKLIDNKRP